MFSDSTPKPSGFLGLHGLQMAFEVFSFHSSLALHSCFGGNWGPLFKTLWRALVTLDLNAAGWFSTRPQPLESGDDGGVVFSCPCRQVRAASLSNAHVAS